MRRQRWLKVRWYAQSASTCLGLSERQSVGVLSRRAGLRIGDTIRKLVDYLISIAVGVSHVTPRGVPIIVSTPFHSPAVVAKEVFSRLTQRSDTAGVVRQPGVLLPLRAKPTPVYAQRLGAV